MWVLILLVLLLAVRVMMVEKKRCWEKRWLWLSRGLMLLMVVGLPFWLLFLVEIERNGMNGSKA